jgi:hypothetical protein
MDKEVVLDNEYITIWYYQKKNIIHHQFHKFTYGKALRDGLSEDAAIIEKKSVQKLLSDDRKNTVISKEDKEWTATVWRPRMIKTNWKYWAIVLPEKVVGQMVMQRIIKEYADSGNGIIVKTFSDPYKAMNWLESQ